jgi:hypothetical protein
LASSAAEPRRPFIFQLPATRGRGVSAMLCPVGIIDQRARRDGDDERVR